MSSKRALRAARKRQLLSDVFSVASNEITAHFQILSNFWLIARVRFGLCVWSLLSCAAAKVSCWQRGTTGSAMAQSASQRSTSRYEMGQTTRSEWESDMRAHRELLRNVIEEHREGRDAALNWGEMIDELALPEEVVYAPTSALATSNPPQVAQGPSGWVYHSTSLGCLRPHHFPRRIAINVVESGPFDPLILITIMSNCTTMAWSSPMDEPGTWKQDFLAVRALPLRSSAVSPLSPRGRAAHVCACVWALHCAGGLRAGVRARAAALADGHPPPRRATVPTGADAETCCVCVCAAGR